MIRALLLVILCAASFAAVYIALPPAATEATAPVVAPAPVAEFDDAPPPEPESIDFELRPGAMAHAGSPAAADVHAVRDVTPENMTAGPDVTGPLTRVEPSADEAAHVREARMRRLFNAIVISAGIIKVRDREIRLAGIEAPDFGLRCGEGADSWPCGRMARAALRSFVRGRAIECEVPAGADEIPDPARCQVAGEDLSAWLVAQGWAKKIAEPYAEAEEAARQAKLGLWGDRRPDAQPAVASSG